MAKFDYIDARNTAVELIDEFGQAGALRRTTSDSDPFNPTQTTTDYPCTFAVLDYATKDIDGSLIKQTDQMAYLSTAGLTISPTTTDILVIGGATRTIVNVKPLSPAGTVLMWELQVRR